MASAMTSIAANDSAAALLHSKNALAKEPIHVQARVLSGELLMANCDPDAGVTWASPACALRPAAGAAGWATL